mmetsp:Transcript_50715/g.58151  ORF Transcript_50715/g.58151 Transcript_50715/m.58151 type:complete len:81 (+) Transcript_50715:144-386(+)
MDSGKGEGKPDRKDHHHKAGKDERLDRHSATGVDGRPKKGGAGGGYTWGKPGSEINADDLPVKKDDPNYDSSDEPEVAAK